MFLIDHFQMMLNSFLMNESGFMPVKFWEDHKILQNLHLTFDWHYMGQKYGGDFGKLCDLFRVYELYLINF